MESINFSPVGKSFTDSRNYKIVAGVKILRKLNL